MLEQQRLPSRVLHIYRDDVYVELFFIFVETAMTCKGLEHTRVDDKVQNCGLDCGSQTELPDCRLPLPGEWVARSEPETRLWTPIPG